MNSDIILPAVITLMVISFFIIVTRVFGSIRQIKLTTKLIGLLCLGDFLFFQIVFASKGLWEIKSCLPLHMCDISLIVCGMTLLYQRQSHFEFVYFWGIIGAVSALLFPTFLISPTGFWYYHFYIGHGLILLSVFWALFVLKLRPKPGSAMKVLAYSQLFLPTVSGINWLLGSNYMFLTELPETTPFGSFRAFPWSLLVFEIAAIICFSLLSLPLRKQKKPKSSHVKLSNFSKMIP